MTIWLQKRLAVWLGVSLCGGALLWNGGALRAQNNESALGPSSVVGVVQRPKLTRDQAAKDFGAFLNDVSQLDESHPLFRRVMAAVSLKSTRELDFKLRPLLKVMASQWKQPILLVKTQSEGKKTAVVTIESAPTQPTKPLVMIEEDGGWGIDLVETYANWNHLQGAHKAEVIYLLTGVVLEGLPLSENITRGTCQSNMKQISLGMMQYVQDYDEAFPPAKKWIDVLQPYVRSEPIFNCPALPKGQHYGYAYNSKLAGKYLNHLPDISRTTSIYETTTLKRNAYGVGENRAFRHQNGANYAFADGHVKWIRKTATPSFKLKP